MAKDRVRWGTFTVYSTYGASARAQYK